MERLVSYELQRKAALVTGASRGIGKSIALTFAAAGADVAVIARDAAALEEIAEQVRGRGRIAVAKSADVTDANAFRDAIAESIDELGRLDVLVNNAGGNSFSLPLATARFSGWEKTMRLNLESVVHACQAVLPHMMERRTGSIVNLSSVVALRGAPLLAHYAAAKAAIVSLTGSLALECASSGIRVNAVLPGWIETDLTGFLRKSEDVERSVLARVPMQRWGRPEEIAAAAQFLASDAASFITGSSLVVDGGLSVMP